MSRILALIVLAAVVVGCSRGSQDDSAADLALTRQPIEADGDGAVTDLQATQEGFVAAGVIADALGRQFGEPGFVDVREPAIWRTTGDGWATVALEPPGRPYARFQPHGLHLATHAVDDTSVVIAGGLSTEIKDIPVWRVMDDGKAWTLVPDQDGLVGDGFAGMASGPVLVAFQRRAATQQEWDVRFSVDGRVWRRNQAGPYEGRVISSVGTDQGFLVSTDVGTYRSPNGIDWRLIPDLPPSPVLASDGESTVMAVAEEGETAVLQGGVGLEHAQQVGHRLPLSNVNAVAVDGELILLVGAVRDAGPPGRISVWLWENGEWLEAVGSMPGIVRTAVASGDAAWLVAGSDGSGPAIWQLSG